MVSHSGPTRNWVYVWNTSHFGWGTLDIKDNFIVFKADTDAFGSIEPGGEEEVILKTC